METVSSKNRTVVLNGIVAAMYLVLTILVAPVASGAIQFRISESLNHLVVFNRKLIWGIVAGVVLYNLMFSNLFDVLFGGGQTLLALLITGSLSKYVKSKWKLMVINTVVFSASMCLIALMLNITLNLPFWPTYGWTALSEFIIMAISAPIMYVAGQKVIEDDE